MTEIPFIKACRRVWHDSAVFVDWHKFDDERSLPERRSDHPRLGNTACWYGIARNCGIAGRTRFDVGAKHKDFGVEKQALIAVPVHRLLVLNIDGRDYMRPVL